MDAKTHNLKNICYCQSCDRSFVIMRPSKGLKTYYCKSCGQFQLVHTAIQTETRSWSEENVSLEFLAAIEKRRQLQATKILKKWSYFLQQNQPILDYACGQGIFYENAIKKGLLINGADLNRFGKHAQSIIQINKPWDTSVCACFKSIILLDVIEHCKDPCQFLMDLKNYNIPILIIKVPNVNGPSAMVARILRVINKPSFWGVLNLVGDYVPHVTFFSRKGLQRILEKTGYQIKDDLFLTEFGMELPERLRFHKSSLLLPLRIFGLFVSAISFFWCDNITVIASLSSFNSRSSENDIITNEKISSNDQTH